MTNSLEKQLRDELVNVAADLPLVRLTRQQVLVRGRQLERRRRAAGIAAAAAVIVVAVTVTSLTTSPRHSDPVAPAPTSSAPQSAATSPAEASESSTPAARPAPLNGVQQERASALAIDGVINPFSTVNRVHTDAKKGPWALIVRRNDGSLAQHGAVVTYPVSDVMPVDPTRIDVGGVSGVTYEGTVLWILAGGIARVQGDLAEKELVAIAARTSIVDGRPRLRAAPSGFVVAWKGLYRSSTHEVRYGSLELGKPALGDGLTYTGVTTGAEFEDELYTLNRGATAKTTTVNGRRAVFSQVNGGNMTLAWEANPGAVLYVGYSGSQFGAAQAAALEDLARRAVGIDEAQWQATKPQTS